MVVDNGVVAGVFAFFPEVMVVNRVAMIIDS